MVAAAASAQSVGETTDPIATAPAVEVTPFIALGSSSSSRTGATISFPLTRDISVESEVGYRRSAITALSATASVLYDLPRAGRIAPYAAAGIGLDQYGVPTLGALIAAPESPRLGVITVKTTGLALNVGAGVKIPVTGRWAYRIDVHWLNVRGDAPEGWRLYHGATLRLGRR